MLLKTVEHPHSFCVKDDMQEWEVIEDHRYSDLYSKGYPSGNPKRFIPLYGLQPDASCIDLGCGPAAMSQFFSDYTGVDISRYVIEINRQLKQGNYYHQSLCSLDNITRHFNYAICSDVMEHIPHEHVETALASIAGLDADYFYFAISTRPSAILDLQGHNLHLSVLPAEEWGKLLSRHFTILHQRVSNNLLVCKAIKKTNSIIIVGNGSSVLDAENGAIIDTFETVVRFNSYKINGFEKFAGTKTDIWFTVNAAHIQEIKNFREVIVHTWQWDKDRCLTFKQLNAERPCGKTEREFVRSLPCKDPSTGLIAIFHFLRQYPRVYITGFDWWDNQKHHYGDNEVRGTLHKPEQERDIIISLKNEGKVSFLQ